MDVIVGGVWNLNAVDRSGYCEAIEPSPEVRVEESTPFQTSGATETSVRRDPGLIDSGSIAVTIVDDATYVMTLALDAIKGTKVVMFWRPDDAVIGVGNPEMTVTVIVPPFVPPVTQGGGARFTVNFACDGLIVVTTA